jgi:hypothetical protein
MCQSSSTGRQWHVNTDPDRWSVLHPADEGALQELRHADNLVDVAGDVVLKGQVRLA